MCSVCDELFSGRLKMLRLPRPVAVTRAVKRDGERPVLLPPFNADNQRKRPVEVLFLKIAHWRPFDQSTHLQFGHTHASVVPNSSRILSEGQQPITPFIPKCSTLDINTSVALDDVAWTLAIPAILHVVLEHNAKDGDYVSVETPQEFFAVQCVKDDKKTGRITHAQSVTNQLFVELLDAVNVAQLRGKSKV